MQRASLNYFYGDGNFCSVKGLFTQRINDWGKYVGCHSLTVVSFDTEELKPRHKEATKTRILEETTSQNAKTSLVYKEDFLTMTRTPDDNDFRSKKEG